ncbi:MAG: DUF262 domain-containing protein [Myxococcales bacterium]|nr:DUF262 domain-containing protein [Myxococcales bacterium]
MSVEDLVEATVDDVRIRVPRFQRRMRWSTEDVRSLLDSIYRGYPIGNLLMWERLGPQDDDLRLGPLRLRAPERPDAWFVVDGQQRTTALAAALRGPDTADDDPFLLYFDLDAHEFVIPPKKARPKATWIPTRQLLDAVDLSTWLVERFPDDKERQRVGHDVGRRIREYKIPIYVVTSDDESVLQEIFRRLNRHGVAMTQAEVFDAMIGSTGQSPRRLDELADDLQRLGMGRLAEHTLLQVVHAVLGRDPTKLVDPKVDGNEAFEGALREAADAMRRVLVFLRDDARIAHLRLLPYKSPLVVLPRFFSLFPEPIPRSRELLVRWVWRGFATGAHADTRRPLREGIRGMDEHDEEASVQHLLSLIPEPEAFTWAPGERFDPRGAMDRIGLLALASLGPLSFEDDGELELAAVLDEFGSDALIPVDRADPRVVGSLGGRILHPPLRGLRARLEGLASTGVWPGLLESHALEPPALEHLVSGRFDEFLELRQQRIADLAQRLIDRQCRWGYGDRPSISRYLHEASE